MDKRDIIKISSKYFRALQNFETSIIKNDNLMVANTYQILDELNEILSKYNESDLNIILTSIKEEISKKPGALNTLDSMKLVFPTYAPLVIGLGAEFTNKVANGIGNPNDIIEQREDLVTSNSDIVESDTLLNDFDNFINKLRQDIRLEFIAFIEAFTISGDYALYKDKIDGMNNISKLKFIISIINKNNGFSNDLIQFNNNQIQMRTMDSGLTDVIYLSEKKEIFAIDATSSFGSEIEGNQFLRHDLAVNRYEELFENSDNKDIIDLRRIVKQVQYQISSRTEDNPYEEFKEIEDKRKFIENIKGNYHVLQSSHFVPRQMRDSDTIVKAMNIMTFLGYFQNTRNNSLGLENDEDIQLFLSKCNIQFVGGDINKRLNTQLSNPEEITKIRQYMNKQIIDFLSGKDIKKDNFVADIFNVKDVYISILKYIDYMQKSECGNDKTICEEIQKFKNLKLTDITNLENSVVYKNNPADMSIIGILNNIKSTSKLINPGQKNPKRPTLNKKDDKPKGPKQ
jgi:hypothetical protein